MDSDFSVVVPTFERPEALAETLAAVMALDNPAPLEIIVVDNAGDDATERVVAHAGDQGGPDVRYAREPRGGAAAARNYGAGLAQGRWLLFCDDDVVPVQPNHLARHLNLHADIPRALAAGAWVFAPKVQAALADTPFGRYRLKLEKGFADEIGGQVAGAERTRVEWISSCDLSLERTLFHEIGGFDEAFPYAGAEDQDLSLRARRAGCNLVYDRSITLHHNDRRLSLAQFATREERSARTAVVLARNFPKECGDRPLVTENSAGQRGDGAALRTKKALKRALGTRVGLRGTIGAVSLAERVGLGDRVLERLYRVAVAVHISRGVRDELCRRPS